MAKRPDTTNTTSRKCSVEGCNREHRARGWCSKHYNEDWYKRVGGPNLQSKITERKRRPGTKKEEACAFLRAHIDDDSQNCIVWPFARDRKGYPLGIRVDGRLVKGHRLMCEMAHGQPPSAGLHVAHSCHNSSCVNPNHLRWATPSENEQDKRKNGTYQDCEQSTGAKLTNEQARAIFADNRSRACIAKAYSISVQTVAYIKTRRTWRAATHAL